MRWCPRVARGHPGKRRYLSLHVPVSKRVANDEPTREEKASGIGDCICGRVNGI